MSQFTLLDPFTGASRVLNDEEDLTRWLQLNVILLRGDEHVGIIMHRDLVSFCRWCAEQVLSEYQAAPTEAHIALTLVDQWLIDPGSVSNEELNGAADAASAADAADASRVTWPAGLQLRAAARAAEAAARPARSAAKAAVAANAAHYSVGVPYSELIQWLVEHLKSNQ